MRNRTIILMPGGSALYFSSCKKTMTLLRRRLLRVEAYLGRAQPGNAATDINVVQARSGAAPVAAGSVNIDYILDERIRELGVEEKKLFTLMRLVKWYDRIVKCNPFYASATLARYNLWPIPQSEIERNRGAVLEQNPGYE